MDLDYDQLKFWLNFAELIAIAGLYLYSMWDRRSRATREEITKLREKLDGGLKSVRGELNKVSDASKDGMNRIEKHFDERFGNLRESRSGDQQRITALERSIDHLPTQGDLAILRKEISVIGQDTAMIKGSLAGIDNLTRLINQFLMEKGARG